MLTGGADTVGVSTAYAVRSSEAAVKLVIRSARASSELKYQILILAVAVSWSPQRFLSHSRRNFNSTEKFGWLFIFNT